MKLEVHYKRDTHGPCKWTAYTIVTQRDPDSSAFIPTKLKIESSYSSTKWGATWSLKRKVRDHLKSNQTVKRFTEIVEL